MQIAECRLIADWFNQSEINLQSEFRKSAISLSFACLVALFLPRPAKDVAQRVVAFVARVLVDEAVGRRPRVLRAPRPGPRRRIVDRELVAQRVRASAREALDDVQVFARAAEAGLVAEVRGVDDQRVAFPSPD